MRKDMFIKTVAATLVSVMTLSAVSMPITAAEEGADKGVGKESAGIVKAVEAEENAEFFGTGENSLPRPTGYVARDWDLNVASLDDSYTPDMIDAMLEDKIPEAGDEDADVFETVPEAPQTEGENVLPAAYPFSESMEPEKLYQYIGADDAYTGEQLPAPRDQNPLEDCWAHSTIALMEIYKDNKDGHIDNTQDLSEAHLVHYTYTTGQNPNTAIAKDSLSVTDSESGAAAEHVKFLIGGDVGSAAATLMHWKGAVKDDALLAPVHDSSKDITQVDDFNKWGNAGNQSGNNEKILKEYYTINIKQNPEYIKHWIREHGAVAISYYSTPEGEGDRYVSLDGIDAHYCDTDSVVANHAVVAVGWDDNYPASNFKAGHQPQRNGAWLVRNSWNSDKDLIKDFYSYFWLSYEDKGLSEAAYAFVPENVSPVNRYDYYYDLQYSIHGYSIYYNLDFLSANIYKNQSGSDEILDSVNFYYCYPGEGSDIDHPQKARVYVYTDLTDPGIPTSGDLVFEGTQDIPFSGHYSLDIKNTVIIKAGSRFSVVVQTFEDSVSYERGLTNDLTTFSNAKVISTVGSSAGESLYNYVEAGASVDTAVSANWVDRSTIENNSGNFIIGACTTSLADLKNKDLRFATVTLSSSADDIIYKGNEWEPEFSVKFGENDALTENTDYTVSFENNVNAGKAKATITGIGSYIGSQTVEFTILPRSIDYAVSVFWSYPDGQEYFEVDPQTGKAEPEFNNVHDEMIDGEAGNLVKGKDYEIEYVDNDKTGTMKIIMNGIGNFTGSRTFEAELHAFLPAGITTGELRKALVYSGKAEQPVFDVMQDGEVLANNKYTVSENTRIDAGKSSVKVTFKAPLWGSFDYPFEITPKEMSSQDIEAVLSQTEYEADGTEKKPEVSVTATFLADPAKQKLVEGTDYTVEYLDNVNTGKAKCLVRGKGNYKGSRILEYDINGVDINSNDVSVTIQDGLVYDGTAKKPRVTVTRNKTVLEENKDFIISYGTGINAGEAELSVTGTGIYFGTKVAKYTIAPADISGEGFSVVLSHDSYVADGTAKTPNVTLYWGSAVLKTDTDYTVAYSDNTDYGTAGVTVTGKGNFKGSRSASFVIEKGVNSADEVEPVKVMIGGETTDVSVKVEYVNTYEYTGKKITPETLGATVDKTGLEELARKAATKEGDVTKLFKVSFSKPKKNINAGDVTFKTKITFDTKKAKKMGISEEDIKALKEAVKALNDELEANKQTFTIKKVNIRNSYVSVSASFKKNGSLKFNWLKVKVNNKNKKPKKNTDFKIVAKDAANNTVTIGGVGKNYEGVITIDLNTKQIVGP